MAERRFQSCCPKFRSPEKGFLRLGGALAGLNHVQSDTSSKLYLKSLHRRYCREAFCESHRRCQHEIPWGLCALSGSGCLLLAGVNRTSAPDTQRLRPPADQASARHPSVCCSGSGRPLSTQIVQGAGILTRPFAKPGFIGSRRVLEQAW